MSTAPHSAHSDASTQRSGWSHITSSIKDGFICASIWAREHTVLLQAHCPSRFRYISNDAGRVKSFLLRIFYRSRTPQPFTHSALLSGG
jgi:hypothetical protein